MSEQRGDDPRDQAAVKLLTNSGVRPKEARQILRALKNIYDVNPRTDISAPDVASTFRRATNKKNDPYATVAGAPFAEFKAYASSRQWSRRDEFGYAWRCDVFTFIDDVYGEWIERGLKSNQPLCQADIKSVDPNLYDRFHRASCDNGRPDWLYLPTASEASLIGITPEERELILARREVTKLERSARIERAEIGALANKSGSAPKPDDSSGPPQP
jgi:hypothetical protein